MTDDLQNENTVVSKPELCFYYKMNLPPFWVDKPLLWFIRAEANFHIAGIDNDTVKFFHVITKLDNQVACEVRDIILNPPSENKYETLKKGLIHKLSLSDQKRIQHLLCKEELAGRKPSDFLKHLISLADTIQNENVLRYLWLRRLPSQVQTVLINQTDLSLDKLAELADLIIEIIPHKVEEDVTLKSPH